jgi:hypothetical protein
MASTDFKQFNMVASHDQRVKAIYESRVKAAKISARWNELILTTMDRVRAFKPDEGMHEEELEEVYAFVVSLTTKEALYRKIELLLQGGDDVVMAEGGEQESQWYCVDLSKDSFGLVTQCPEGCSHAFQVSPDIERVHFLVRLGEDRGRNA